MPHITSIERIATQKGIELGINKGIRETLVEILETRFQSVPSTLKDRILEIDDEKLLKLLVKKAVVTDSVDMFGKIVDSSSCS